MTPSGKQVVTVATEMYEFVTKKPWRSASIEEQRLWCNAARTGLSKAHVSG